MARVFSQKHSLTFMVNVGIYSVGIESVYQIGKSGKTECFVSVLQGGLTRETQLSPSCLDSSHSSYVQGTCIISWDA